MSETNTSLGRVLVLCREESDANPIVGWLQERADVHVESSLSAAVAALAREPFDLVVSADTGLLSAPVPGVDRRLSAVLDTIDHGVGVLEPRGRLIWSNARAREFPDQVWQRIEEHCFRNFSESEGGAASNRQRLLSLVIENEFYFETRISPILDGNEQVIEWVAVVADVTRARRLQKKMDAIDNAGRELVRIDADQLKQMDVRHRLELLEQNTLRYTRELLHFDNFAIRLLEKNTNKLELVLCAGLPPEAQQIDIYASTENSGISGYVGATGRSYICPDVQKDPRYLKGIDNARSSLTVPLRLHDQVIGVLNIESDRSAAFSEDDRQFAEIFGRYVAIALNILNLLVAERHTATGRLADNVSSEIAGPLGTILAEATTLMEDYIGHDDLRRRLQGISDSVVKIKEVVRHAARPVDGLLGARPKAPDVDPLLAGKRVLVVDDEETILLAVRDVLSSGGCEVELARDGNEALAMINQRSYDLVLSDIRMPGHSGYDIFAAVKCRFPGCPVMFMTGFGYDPNHSIIRASQEGLASVLYKPFKVDQLLSDVRAAVSSDSVES